MVVTRELPGFICMQKYIIYLATGILGLNWEFPRGYCCAMGNLLAVFFSSQLPESLASKIVLKPNLQRHGVF